MTRPLHRSDIHRKALFAASTVVLAMTAGCTDGGALVPKDSDLLVDSDAGQDVLDTARGLDTASTDTDADTDRLDTDRPADTDLAALEGPDCRNVADMTTCCDERRTWCEGEVGTADETALNDCVFGPGFDGSTGCIPWGPPAPPAARVA